ncbi:MAG: CapA family protein [Anaerolineales bacterium]|nr:CapA family protein [Anaerolineales bacterium]
MKLKRLGLFVLLSLLVGSAACQPIDVGGQAVDVADLTSVPTAEVQTPTSLIADDPATETPRSTDLPEATPIPQTPTEEPLTTLLFTGVIVPARCVQAEIDERGNYDYIYDEVREIIQEADLAIGTLNAAISDYPPRTGCKSTYVLVTGSESADAMQRAGFDAMSVATNHIKNCGPTNCGDRAFFDTLANLERVGIQYVGAGENHAAAMQPLVIEVNGVRFGIVSLGQIEQLAFAGEDTPGIAILNEENLRAAIAEVKAISDVVIAMPHWGPEDVPDPNWSQRILAQTAVDAGADLVMGNHTHVVQAIQEIDGVPVFYGLGNFVFDQSLRDHQQGVILEVTFRGTEFVGYELIPTHVDRDGAVYIADEDEAAEILERIETASAKLP